MCLMRMIFAAHIPLNVHSERDDGWQRFLKLALPPFAFMMAAFVCQTGSCGRESRKLLIAETVAS